MPRINPVSPDCDCEKAQSILNSVKASIGTVPNLISTMAQSPAVANAYLGFSQTLSEGVLCGKLREQIALTVGEANSCGYCVSAHTMLGANAGLSEAEILDARRGTSSDEKTAAALSFARKVVTERGHVTDCDVKALHEAGFCDAGIAEIVANVALNLFTNYFNHVADTEIDFPVAEALNA